MNKIYIFMHYKNINKENKNIYFVILIKHIIQIII